MTTPAQPIQTQAPPVIQDPAKQILDSAQGVDNDTKASAWDVYHGAKDENDLVDKLKSVNVPNDVKANLWDAKHAAQSTSVPPPTAGIGPHNPSLWERAKKVVTEGIPSLSSRTVSNPKYGQEQFLSPEEAMTPLEQQAHPIAMGVGEVAGSLTSPANVAIMAATGGLGVLSGPETTAAKAVIPRLISAGFSAQQVIQAAQESPEVLAAIKRGDISEAERLTTHVVLSLAGAALGAQHASGAEATPTAAGETVNRLAGKTFDKAQLATQAVASTVAGSASHIIDTAGKLGVVLGRTNDFKTAIYRSAKVTPKNAEVMKGKIAAEEGNLQAIINSNPDIESPKDVADAIDKHLQANEAHMLQESGATKDENKPISPDFRDRVSNRLDKFFDDNRGKFGSAEETQQAKADVLDRVMQRDQVDVDAKGKPVYQERAPNLYETENIRQGLNNETKPQYATNAKPTTDAYKAGAAQAVSEIRDIIDGAYHERGIKNVQEFRESEGRMIDIAQALRDAQTKADTMGKGGVFQSLMAKIGVPSSVVAIALGHPIGAAGIGAAVVADQMHQNLTNPTVNTGRSVDLAAKNPGAQATSVDVGNPPGPVNGPVNQIPIPAPINHALYSALSTYYDKRIGAVPFERLEQAFNKEIQGAEERTKTGMQTPEDNAKLDQRRDMLKQLNDAEAKQRVESDKAQRKAAADAAKEAKKAADNKAAEDFLAAEKDKAAREKEEADRVGNESIAHGRVMNATESALDINGVEGHTPEQAHEHEHGHIMANVAEGLNPITMISETHPDAMKENAAAAVQTDVSGAEEGDKGLAQRVVGVLGGPAFDEVHHGISLNKNLGARGDIARAREILREEGGLKGAQLDKVFDALYDRAKEHVSNPEALALVKANAPLREAGLHPDYHISAGRMQEYVNKLKGVYGNGKTSTTAGVREGDTDAGVQEGESDNSRAVGKEQDGAAKGVSSEGVRETKGKSEDGKPEGRVKENGYDNRPAFLNDTSTARIHKANGRAGETMAVSVPAHGVTPEQVESIKKSVGQSLDRNGQLRMERADVSSGNKHTSTTEKDFPRASDVEGMLREINAHPDQKGAIETSALSRNAAAGWIRPEGDFQEFDKQSSSHPQDAQRMKTTPEALLDKNWIRKAGMGSYEGNLTPQTIPAIENDLRADYKQMKSGNEYGQPVSSVVIDASGGRTSTEIPLDKLKDSNFDLRKFITPKDTISTRVPQGKNATENPLEGAPLHIDREAIEASPQRLQDKFANKARNITGVKIPKNITDNGKIYDRFARHVADNLKFVYDQATPKEQEDNAKWYESANKLTKDLSDQHGITHQQAAGVTAAMSPQMSWDTNVSLAKRIIDIYKNKGNEVVTPEMIQKGRDIVANSRSGKDKSANSNMERILPGIEGKKLSELTDPYDRAAALRLYDETNNSKDIPRIDPATGNEGEPMQNDNGSKQQAAWGSLANISKAMSILDDGSRENISKQVGDAHKVRNFYNNIINPSDPNSVTIDTHAVGAGTLQPLGGNSPEVLDNFGKGGKSLASGVRGTYPLYAEGYKLAAKELGILPRELQSVTWEKIRNLFPAEFKNAANLKAVQNEWKKYTDGDQSAAVSRQNIVKMAEEARAVKAVKLQAQSEKAASGNLAGSKINSLDFLKAFGHNKDAEPTAVTPGESSFNFGANALGGGE
jgi:hypothetical protein